MTRVQLNQGLFSQQKAIELPELGSPTAIAGPAVATSIDAMERGLSRPSLMGAATGGVIQHGKALAAGADLGLARSVVPATEFIWSMGRFAAGLDITLRAILALHKNTSVWRREDDHIEQDLHLVAVQQDLLVSGFTLGVGTMACMLGAVGLARWTGNALRGRQYQSWSGDESTDTTLSTQFSDKRWNVNCGVSAILMATHLWQGYNMQGHSQAIAASAPITGFLSFLNLLVAAKALVGAWGHDVTDMRPDRHAGFSHNSVVSLLATGAGLLYSAASSLTARTHGDTSVEVQYDRVGGALMSVVAGCSILGALAIGVHRALHRPAQASGGTL